MRKFLEELEKGKELVKIKKEVSCRYEIPALLKKLDGRAVLFEKIKESRGYRIAGNVCSSRELIAKALGVEKSGILKKILKAVEKPEKFESVKNAPCQEIVEKKVDLDGIPILTHYEKDAGAYVTSGIIVAHDKEYGYNASFHRLLKIGKDMFAARILPRHLDEFIKRGNREIAITIGNHPAFMIAGAVSCEIGRSELEIANAIKRIEYAKCVTNDILVPAECELVLEGTITDELVDEGPFADITNTYDVMRKQRVIKINCITRRRDPVYQALVPALNEHKLLMGMPREPTIFREVNRVCKCLDAKLTSGGCGWLHGVVRIKKEKEDDGRKAIEAAFRGHGSLKHVVVVDEGIDTENMEDVEWAIATRVQADRNVILKPKQVGSSLDPSADPMSRETCKVGIDATVPHKKKGKEFKKVSIPGEEKIRLKDYL